MEQKLINITYDLVDEIKQSKAYTRLIELQECMSNDQHLQQLITQFNKSKTKYDDISKYGKYHPDLKSVQVQFSEDKNSLYSHPVIVEYKQLERDIQSLLNHVSKEIAQAVSTKIKHPNEIGLIPKH